MQFENNFEIKNKRVHVLVGSSALQEQKTEYSVG